MEETTEPPKFTCKEFVKRLTLEPFLFIIMSSMFMKDSVVTQLILDKQCVYEYNFTLQECANFSENNTYKIAMEKVANNYKTYMSLIEFGPGAFMAIMLGQWSDKYGRKFAVYLTIFGMTFQYVGLLLNSHWMELPIPYLLLAAVPAGLTGGVICVFAAAYAIATESSVPERRALKYALLELGFGLGIPFGMMLGGQLIRLSYGYVFLAACVMLLVSSIWFFFLVRDPMVKQKASLSQKIRDFFNFEQIKEGLLICTRKRENNGRLKLFLMISAMCVYLLSYLALGSVAYIVVHHVFKWDVTKYNNINAIFSIFKIFTSILAVIILVKRFKIQEPILGLIGVTSIMTGTIIKGFAFKPWIYILALVCDPVGGLGALALRSMISKLVLPDELGKVFALVAACESLIPLAGTTMFAQISNASLSFYPQLPFLVTAVITLLPLAVFIWLFFVQRKVSYDNLEEKKVKENSQLQISEGSINYGCTEATSEQKKIGTKDV